jgi:hypothetical protein
VNKSCWSFVNSLDIQKAFPTAFTDVTWVRDRLEHKKVSWDSLDSFFSECVKEVPSAGFVDAFMDLVLYINTCPPGTPITVEWNKNLPRYVSTGESQVFKAFTDLPNDLPFAYGSLTASRTSLRPWLGPKNTSAFHVPGMEFFATTGEYKNETEWRNPAGAWLRQIIPKGDQLPKFLEEIEKICNDLAKDLPAEDIVEDDSLDGRITLSHKGVHFAETKYEDGWVATGFGEDMLDTDLTQAIQSTEVLHILIPCNSATHKVITAGESGACAGQMDSACNSNISSATAGNAAGQAANIVVCAEEPAYCDLLNAQAQAPDIQAANLVEEASCFRRATDSTESLDDIAPAAVSSPWKPASLPFSFFETPYKFTGRWFRQITPLSIRNARSPGTNLISTAPRLAHSLGALGPMPHAAPQLFQRAAEVALGVSFNAQSQAPDIPGASSRAFFLRLSASLQAHVKAPDISSLRADTEELASSLNAQAQAPDDPPQTLVSDFHFLSLRAYMEELSASFNAQDQAPDDFHAQDRQCDPYIFVEYFRHCRQDPARLSSTQDSSYLSLQQVSRDRAQELFARHLSRPYQGVSRIEFFVCCLWIPVVRQGVFCSLSVGLGCSWIFTAIVFNDPCGSTLFVSMYIYYA